MFIKIQHKVPVVAFHTFSYHCIYLNVSVNNNQDLNGLVLKGIQNAPITSSAKQ